MNYQIANAENIKHWYKPRRTLMNEINAMGFNSFIFSKDDDPFFAVVKFTNSSHVNLIELEGQPYVLNNNCKNNVYNKVFIPVNEFSERYINTKKNEIKVETNKFDNYMKVVPLYDCNQKLIDNVAEKNKSYKIPGVKAFDFSKNKYESEKEVTKNYKMLVEYNFRCRARNEVYNPLNIIPSDGLKYCLYFQRTQPEKAYNIWKDIFNKIKLENKQYISEKQNNLNKSFNSFIKETISQLKGNHR